MSKTRTTKCPCRLHDYRKKSIRIYDSPHGSLPQRTPICCYSQPLGSAGHPVLLRGYDFRGLMPHTDQYMNVEERGISVGLRCHILQATPGTYLRLLALLPTEFSVLACPPADPGQIRHVASLPRPAPPRISSFCTLRSATHRHRQPRPPSRLTARLPTPTPTPLPLALDD